MKSTKRASELSTLKAMIDIYCRSNHHSPNNLCSECSNLFTYASNRLEKCPFTDAKPACSSCEIHCYKPEMRNRIREVMMFSGPRMIIAHPVMALRHLLNIKSRP